MAITSSICAIVLEQTERTRQISKADIERLIEQTQLKIASLQSQIERERAIAAALTYIISPVRALPVELLAEIFVLAIRDRTHITDVLRLSQVCSDGGRLLMPPPRLWTGLIRVNLDNESGSLKEAYADGLKAWLDNLEELFLGTIGPNTSHLDPLCFTGAPRLRKLGVKFRSNDPQILIPWAQLADLTLDNLIRASLCIPGWHELPEAGRDIHVLSRLRTLSLAIFGSAGKVSPIFDCISAPALEELRLRFDDMENDVDWKLPIYRHSKYGAPHLARLDLRYATLRGDDLVDPLHYKQGVRPLVPRLHNLILEHTGEMFTPGVLADMITSRMTTPNILRTPWRFCTVKGLPIELLNRSDSLRSLIGRKKPPKYVWHHKTHRLLCGDNTENIGRGCRGPLTRSCEDCGAVLSGNNGGEEGSLTENGTRISDFVRASWRTSGRAGRSDLWDLLATSIQSYTYSGFVRESSRKVHL
ncbi:hypothetical protein B0H14DRAFT_3606210 [Mycena olivaceomarginata]|nr:hypothetical protein B0H14DRAFT_3606210 [Mycena olivaceomarginata]